MLVCTQSIQCNRNVFCNFTEAAMDWSAQSQTVSSWGNPRTLGSPQSSGGTVWSKRTPVLCPSRWRKIFSSLL